MQSGGLWLLSIGYFVSWRLTNWIRRDHRRMRRVRSGFYDGIWRDAAKAAQARFEPLDGGGALIERDARTVRVSANAASLDSHATEKLVGDKPAVHRLLTRAGVPVPYHIVVELNESNRAAPMLRSSSSPLVVKPSAYTAGGAGVSTNITNVRQLRQALAWARVFGRRILVEKQVEGHCYRVLLMDGKVLDAVVRRPPAIVGDGRSTVRQLLRRENQLRLKVGAMRAQGLISTNSDLHNTLSRQGLRMNSCPKTGETVVLKGAINENRREENTSVKDRLYDAILEAARTSVEVLGVRLGGVDIACNDPTVPLEDSAGAVIEVNTGARTLLALSQLQFRFSGSGLYSDQGLQPRG